MFHNPNYRKFFLVSGSLILLLALGVVLGLTVVRIQNRQPTVTQPKAAQCARGNCYRVIRDVSTWKPTSNSNIMECGGCPEFPTSGGASDRAQRGCDADCYFWIFDSGIACKDSDSCGGCSEFPGACGPSTTQSEILPQSGSTWLQTLDNVINFVSSYGQNKTGAQPSLLQQQQNNVPSQTTTNNQRLTSPSTPGTTVTQPKAADSCQPAPECCTKIASGAGFDACSWSGGRGWCRPEQCAGSDGVDSNCAHENGDPNAPRKGPANCNCGLFVLNYCSQQPKPEENKNPCWTNQPIPKNFNASTLSWEWDTTWSSEIKSANAYVWTSSARSGDAYATAAINSSTGFKSVKITDFSPALQPNTTYYLKVNPNSYYYPDQAYWCMDKATEGWKFMTGQSSGFSVSGKVFQDANKNGKVDSGEEGLADHAVTLGNRAGTETFKEVKTDSKGNYRFTDLAGGEYRVTHKLSTGMTRTTDDSRPFVLSLADFVWDFGVFGTTACTRDSDCGICTDAASGDCLVCVGGECLPTKQTRLACGSKNACIRQKGTGDNKDGCSSVGASCTSACTKDFDCPSGQVCTNGKCTSGEVNACWGNGGTNGKCYDCNGDGEVNILDFSCFRSKYQQNVQ